MKITIKLKICLIIGIIILGVICFQNKVEAKSYSIDNMDIQATVQTNGDVKIEQTLTYTFDGSYNGVYITVPINLDDSTYNEVIKNKRINDNLYNGTGVTIEKLGTLVGNNITEFTKNDNAVNGSKNVYTSTLSGKIYTIKLFSPSNNETKKFGINYTIQNLCLRHNDTGELYYNFIGGAWEVPIKKLNIDIRLPNNKQDIKIWGHGPANGESKIVSNQDANFKVSNVQKGQYVAARVIFDVDENIPSSTKSSGIYALDEISKEEKDIFNHVQEKDNFTRNIIVFTICLLAYWVILMLIYEKDKKYMVSDVGEDELFKKYDPILAGCIQGSRTILARDIIAEILSLIDRGFIHLDIIKTLKNKEGYKYLISRVSDKEENMTSIEKYVYEWVFSKGEEFEINKDSSAKDLKLQKKIGDEHRENINQVVLNERLKEMPKELSANQKFKSLNSMVESKLAEIGANNIKVPLFIRVFNVFLFILSIVFVAKHILYNGLNIYDSGSSINIIGMIGFYLIVVFLPLVFGLIGLIANLIIIVRHKVNKIVQKISGQKVVTTTISLIILFALIIILTAIFAPDKYIVADEFLICVSSILILTDNLMMKNNVMMIEDYSKLNTLKYRIENSLLEDRDIQYVTLWGEYLAYAVAFGIPSKIVKRMDGLNIDTDLSELVTNEDFLNMYIYSGYNDFYTFASLDSRFIKSYNHFSGEAIKATGGMMSGGDGSRRRRRRLLWRWWILWRRRPAGRWRWSFLIEMKSSAN